MRNLLQSLTIVTLASCLTTSAFAAPSSKTERALNTIEKSLKRGHTEKAQRKLDRLFENGDADEIQAAKDRVIELTKRIAFQSIEESITPNSVVSGDLEKYDAKSGKVRIRYNGDTLGDFKSQSGMLTHPATFEGAYRIDLEGQSYPERGYRVQVDKEGRKSYTINFGVPTQRTFSRQRTRESRYWQPGKIHYRGDHGTEELAHREATPALVGKKFDIRIEVGASRITATCNGRKCLVAKKLNKDFGRVAIPAEIHDSIVLEGRIDTSWIEDKIREARETAKKKFEKEFRPENHLPEWLR